MYLTTQVQIFIFEFFKDTTEKQAERKKKRKKESMSQNFSGYEITSF